MRLFGEQLCIAVTLEALYQTDANRPILQKRMQWARHTGLLGIRLSKTVLRNKNLSTPRKGIV